MCEWAYFIDFEKHTLETWTSSERFSGEGRGYTNVKVDEASFDKLGLGYMEGLGEILKGREEEE